MDKTPIVFMESIPTLHDLNTELTSDSWLYKRYELIDENHEMSEGERRAWIINGKATTDLDYIDTQGNIYKEGTRYFTGTHVWKRIPGQNSILYVAKPHDSRQTSDTWVETEWEIV